MRHDLENLPQKQGRSNWRYVPRRLMRRAYDMRFKKVQVPAIFVRASDNAEMDVQAEKERLTRINRRIFMLMVVLPSLIALVYYSMIASDQYESQARLVVRTIGIVSKDDGEDEAQGSVSTQSLNQDAYIVANFLKSPEIVDRLNEQINLRAMFDSDDIDFWSRLSKDATREEFYNFWNDQTITYVDGPSGIIVFTLRAFQAEDAVTISRAALEEARKLINQLSERAKRDLVKRGEAEVVSALENYQQKLLALSRYQKETGLLSPIASAKITQEISAVLYEEKLKAETRLALLDGRKARNSPIKKQLEQLIENLDRQIEDLKLSISGNLDSGATLSNALVTFSKLETERLVAQNIYEVARKNLDVANSTALRKTSYLSVFSRPTLAQDPSYPARFTSILIAMVGALLLWAILRLLWASVEDHRR